ncbi:MAG: cell division protein FtsQ/DivIB [Actinomycetota bacterium]|nr:FtsQ-type POTRA domain-containing protein [Actinomycetota bacterium]
MSRPPAEVLHPARLVARRREVRRQRVTRIRRIVVSVFAVCLLTYGGWSIAHSSLFALDGVEIVGAHHVTRSQVLSVSGVRLGMNVLSVEPGVVAGRIEKLPFVGAARVERIYPSKVRILISERVPVAVVSMPGGRYLIDDRGVALVPVGETDGLPVIRSASGDEVQLGRPLSDAGALQGLLIWRSLPVSLRSKVFTIDATSPVAVTINVEGASVVFGDASSLGAKVAVFGSLLERARTTHHALLSADLRAPTHPAARFSS